MKQYGSISINSAFVTILFKLQVVFKFVQKNIESFISIFFNKFKTFFI